MGMIFPSASSWEDHPKPEAQPLAGQPTGAPPHASPMNGISVLNRSRARQVRSHHFLSSWLSSQKVTDDTPRPLVQRHRPACDPHAARARREGPTGRRQALFLPGFPFFHMSCSQLARVRPLCAAHTPLAAQFPGVFEPPRASRRRSPLRSRSEAGAPGVLPHPQPARGPAHAHSMHMSMHMGMSLRPHPRAPLTRARARRRGRRSPPSSPPPRRRRAVAASAAARQPALLG